MEEQTPCTCERSGTDSILVPAFRFMHVAGVVERFRLPCHVSCPVVLNIPRCILAFSVPSCGDMVSVGQVAACTGCAQSPINKRAH